MTPEDFAELRGHVSKYILEDRLDHALTEWKKEGQRKAVVAIMGFIDMQLANSYRAGFSAGVDTASQVITSLLDVPESGQ